MGIFDGTIEGNIADGIVRWLMKNTEHLDAILSEEIPESEKKATLYVLMDAEAWLESAHTEDTTFAYICSHDPKQMFNIAFSLAMMKIKMNSPTSPTTKKGERWIGTA